MDKKPLIVKCLAVGIILLFIGVTIAASINFNTVKASTCDDLVEVTTHKQSGISTEFKLGFPTQGLYYVFPLLIFYEDLFKPLRDWTNKPFPNTTAMFIGGGIGICPFLNVSIVLYAYSLGYPDKLDVYSDGKYYDTLYPKFLFPSICFYFLFYYEKGFHSLKFVAEDNTSLTLDVQIGWNGFTDNILPYLLKTNIVGKDTI